MDDPTERKREYQRQYAADNADRKRDAARLWRQQNPERSRQSRRDYVQTHYEEVLEYGRRQRRLGRKTPRERKRDEALPRLWAEQGGLCYLCERPTALDRMILEHDHRCCPARDWCLFCVRGAACQPCNQVIGFAQDDPDRLERVALNLRIKLAEVSERLASKPEQLSLG